MDSTRNFSTRHVSEQEDAAQRFGHGQRDELRAHVALISSSPMIMPPMVMRIASGAGRRRADEHAFEHDADGGCDGHAGCAGCSECGEVGGDVGGGGPGGEGR